MFVIGVEDIVRGVVMSVGHREHGVSATAVHHVRVVSGTRGVFGCSEKPTHELGDGTVV